MRHELAPRLSAELSAEAGALSAGGLGALYVLGAHGAVLDLIASPSTGVYQLLAYLGFGALCFGVWLPLMVEGVGALARVAWRWRRAGWPAWLCYGLFFLAALLGLFVGFSLLHNLPFPSRLLDPAFAWPEDGLTPFGAACLKSEVVLALYGLACGLRYARR